MKYCEKLLSILFFFVLQNFLLAQNLTWPLLNSDATCINQVNATFSEVHGEATVNHGEQPHIHGGIDLRLAYGSLFNAITSTADARVFDTGAFTVVRWNYQDPLNDNTYLNQARYGDVTQLYNVSDGDAVTNGQLIGKMTDSGNPHLHFEIQRREYDANTKKFTDFKKVDPLNNELGYNCMPLDINMGGIPQINDVIIQPVNEPIGINSGYLIKTNNGALSNFSEQTLKIHTKNRKNLSGTEYVSKDNSFVVFGSIGSILYEGDTEVTIDNSPICGHSGEPAFGIYSANFSIGNVILLYKFENIYFRYF